MSEHHTVIMRNEWDRLAETIAAFVVTDDPRLGTAVLAVESWVGCELGAAERSPIVLGRRFARAHARALTIGRAPVPTEVLAAA
jgi:hypothetical protein